jgi:peptidoglycan/LPS O-acetylase OafA/YrhL
VPALDGLRGIAILLVMAFHFTGQPFGGPYGVDLFFVLSGFLITTLLLEERECEGQVRLAAFYMRRARRLLPALVAMLACYLLFEAARGRNALADVADYGLYAGNLYYVIVHHPDTTGLGHLWSLAEEEQFYLVWPAALLVLARARRPLRWLLVIIGCLVTYRYALTLGAHASMTRLYRAPDTHSEGLVMGAALAFARRNGFRANETLAKIGLALAIPPVFVGQWTIGVLMFELGAVCLVAAAVGETEFAGLLAWRPFVWLGTLSYSLYVWHFPVIWTFGHKRVLVALAVTLCVSWLSYRFIERPFRAAGPLLRRAPRRIGLLDSAG